MRKTKDPNAQITNKDLNEAVDAILAGMDKIILETRNGFSNINENFATKKDLLLVKDELKTEILWLKDDIEGVTADLVDTVSKKEHNKLKAKVDKYLAD